MLNWVSFDANTVDFCSYNCENMIIMIKQKVKIMLLGLMCFSFISSFFTVSCISSEGHNVVELVVHNHCDCPETSEINRADAAMGMSFGHDHCTDFKIVSDVIVPIEKNFKLLTNKVFIATLFTKPLSTYTSSLFICFTAQGNELFPFYTPLWTIILLS